MSSAQMLTDFNGESAQISRVYIGRGTDFYGENAPRSNFNPIEASKMIRLIKAILFELLAYFDISSSTCFPQKKTQTLAEKTKDRTNVTIGRRPCKLQPVKLCRTGSDSV
jgi:hypothetical protein